MRVTFSKEENTLLRLIEGPFSSDAEELSINLQMEVIELQNFICHSVMYNKNVSSSSSCGSTVLVRTLATSHGRFCNLF
jgi:hypothetical protein